MKCFVCVCLCLCVTRRASMWTCATRTTKRLWTSSTSSPPPQPAGKSNRCSEVRRLLLLFWFSERKMWGGSFWKVWREVTRKYVCFCCSWCRGVQFSPGQSGEGLLEPPRSYGPQPPCRRAYYGMSFCLSSPFLRYSEHELSIISLSTTQHQN